MSRPPRRPRALFIAAFAAAGMALAPISKPRLPPLTPATIEKRNRTMRTIAKHCGAAIVAANRALDAFHKRGQLYAPPKPVIDPRVEAVMTCAGVVAAIGPVVLADDKVPAWIEISGNRINIFWRGTRVEGERRGTVEVWSGPKQTGTMHAARATGQRLPSMRLYSDEQLDAAIVAARTALAKAGFRTSAFTDRKFVNTPNFEGGLATIVVMGELPAWLQPGRTRQIR